MKMLNTKMLLLLKRVVNFRLVSLMTKSGKGRVEKPITYLNYFPGKQCILKPKKNSVCIDTNDRYNPQAFNAELRDEEDNVVSEIQTTLIPTVIEGHGPGPLRIEFEARLTKIGVRSKCFSTPQKIRPLHLYFTHNNVSFSSNEFILSANRSRAPNEAVEEKFVFPIFWL